MEMHSCHWGIDHFPVIIMQPVSVAVLALLEDLELEKNRHAFISLCVTIRAAARRFRVAKGILRLVSSTAEQKKIELPRETRQLFSDFEHHVVREEKSDIGDIGLDYLLEKWDDLDLMLELDGDEETSDHMSE